MDEGIRRGTLPTYNPVTVGDIQGAATDVFLEAIRSYLSAIAVIAGRISYFYNEGCAEGPQFNRVNPAPFWPNLIRCL